METSTDYFQGVMIMDNGDDLNEFLMRPCSPLEVMPPKEVLCGKPTDEIPDDAVKNFVDFNATERPLSPENPFKLLFEQPEEEIESRRLEMSWKIGKEIRFREEQFEIQRNKNIFLEVHDCNAKGILFGLLHSNENYSSIAIDGTDAIGEPTVFEASIGKTQGQNRIIALPGQDQFFYGVYLEVNNVEEVKKSGISLQFFMDSFHEPIHGKKAYAREWTLIALGCDATVSSLTFDDLERAWKTDVQIMAVIRENPMLKKGKRLSKKRSKDDLKVKNVFRALKTMTLDELAETCNFIQYRFPGRINF